MRHRVLAALVAAAAISIVAGPAAAQGSPPTVAANSTSRIGGLVPPLTSFRAPLADIAGICPSGCSGSDLDYHGGKVMRTNATYAIFWLPPTYSFNSNNAGYENTITQFLTDVAAASGTTGNVYATDTQYYDMVGGGTHNVAYASTYAGSVEVHTALPTNGCVDVATTICLSDAQLHTEIQNVVTAQGWPQDDHTEYFLLTPPGVGSCFATGPADCAYTAYCAYHGSFPTTSGHEIIYANQPWTSGLRSCDTGEYPNSSDADPTINVLSHEHNESITDPNVSSNTPSEWGWFDDTDQEENGDKCAWNFDALSGSEPHLYNQDINGHHYYLQEEYSNAVHDCLQGLTAPSVTAFAPASGDVGALVTLTGTHFGDTTAVSFNGTPADWEWDSREQITALVPNGATSGRIKVTSPNGFATSATDFVVNGSSPPPPPPPHHHHHHHHRLRLLLLRRHRRRLRCLCAPFRACRG